MGVDKKSICVVGLGNMGGAVAANLVVRGYDVIGYDSQEPAKQRAASTGVRLAETITQAVANAGIVITSLPNGAIVRSVWLGDAGIVKNAKQGAIVVELSTIGPDTMREIAVEADRAGLRVVDCAVSGSPEQGRNGELSLIIGSDTEVLAEVDPLLSDIGTSRAHVGGIGTGKTVKLVNNLMAMGNVLVAAEAFQVGVAAGVDPQRLYEVLAQGGGRSHHFTNRFPKAIAGDFRPGFTVRLGEKDLGLGLDLARSVGVPAPVAATVRAMYSVGIAEGVADDDIVGLLQLYQRWSDGGTL